MYVVVLNLFVEFSDVIVVESFWISIVTAVLLKGILDVVVGLEHAVGEYSERFGGTLSNVLSAGSRFLILFASKFIILEIVDLVFRESVELGHFLDVLVLIIGMMAARALLQEIYLRLGKPVLHDS